MALANDTLLFCKGCQFMLIYHIFLQGNSHSRQKRDHFKKNQYFKNRAFHNLKLQGLMLKGIQGISGKQGDLQQLGVAFALIN